MSFPALDHRNVLIIRRCDTLQTDRFSQLHPEKFVKATELHGSSCRTTFYFI